MIEEVIEPMNDLQLVINSKDAINQISDRVNRWQDDLSSFLTECEEYANCYRLMERQRKSDPYTLTRTRSGETIRGTEALTTSIYRMLTVQDPPYEPVAEGWDVSASSLFASHLLLRYQDHKLKWKPKLLRSVRGGVLFGTTIVETPWVQEHRFGQLIWEGLGFIPRSLLQCAFDPNVINISESPWFAFLDYMSEDQLLDKAEEDPENWNPEQIQACIDTAKASKASVSDKIEARRRRAGYRDLPLYEVCTYYGRLRNLPREDKRLWLIRLINMSHPVAAMGNPSPTGRIPVKVANYISFELEPYGYGVGRLGRLAQGHMDANRERYMDMITMSLYNMWIKDRMAGVRNTDLKIKPLGIIEADDVKGLTPFRPDLNAVNFGLLLEERLKAEHQGNTGATPGLQAQVTDASATEASITQNEAIRRVSVIAEDMADSLIRDYQQEKHEYNTAWLQMDKALAMNGMKMPIRVNRMKLAPEMEVFVRVTTDKDFRPKRMEYMEKFIQVATSIRNVLPRNINLDPVFQEWVRGLDIDPARVILPPDPSRPPSLQEQMITRMRGAHTAAQEMGDDAEAALDDAGVSGGGIDTPVGEVAMTP